MSRHHVTLAQDRKEKEEKKPTSGKVHAYRPEEQVSYESTTSRSNNPIHMQEMYIPQDSNEPTYVHETYLP